MKRILPFLLAVCMLLSSAAFASADGQVLSLLGTRDTFVREDTPGTGWHYYQFLESATGKDVTLTLLMAAWGESDAFTYYPEMRIFLENASGESYYAESLLMIVDGNIFDFKPERTELTEQQPCGVFYLTGEADSFLRCMAAASSVSVMLSCEEASYTAFPDKDEIAPLSLFARDMLTLNYQDHMSGSAKETEEDLKSRTPFSAYVSKLPEFVPEIIPDEPANDEPASITGEEDTKCYMMPSGAEVTLPASFSVYHIGMDPADPLLAELGSTADEVDEILKSSDLDMDAYAADKSAEFRLSVSTSVLSDFSDTSEETLSLYAAQCTDAYKENNIGVKECRIYRNDLYTYIIYDLCYAGADSTSSDAMIAMTVTSGRLLQPLYISAGDEMTEAQILEAYRILDSLRLSDSTVTETAGPEKTAAEIEAERIEAEKAARRAAALAKAENEAAERAAQAAIDPVMAEYPLGTTAHSILINTKALDVLYRGMPEEDAALLRSGYTNRTLSAYLGLMDRSMVMYAPGDTLPAEVMISVQTKPYALFLMDVRTDDADEVLAAAAAVENVTAGETETMTIGDVTYLRYSCLKDTEQHYITVIGGDVIHISIRRAALPLNQWDLELVKNVVEGIRYTDEIRWDMDEITQAVEELLSTGE